MNRTSARERLDAALARIADPKGEGARACLTIYREQALAAADAADARARNGISLGPLDGAIVSIKDLFDVAGEVTRAGSKFIAEEGKAGSGRCAHRAPAAPGGRGDRRQDQHDRIRLFRRRRQSAFRHAGQSGRPQRAPGGSTSGGAVAAADGMCEIAIGSDTGGSTRIPAALCGIVGFKPSRQRVPTDGAFPLSYTLDSIGPMAKTVRRVRKADAVMAGDEPEPLEPAALAGLRIGVAQGAAARKSRRHRGQTLSRGARPPGKSRRASVGGKAHSLLDQMDAVNAKGGIPPAEAFAVHRDRLARRGDMADPNVRVRIERAGKIAAADYIDMLRERAALIRAMDARLADLDVLAMPTTPIVAPLLADVAKPDDFFRQNALVLRNTSIWNFFDCCAITLPLPREGGLPTGLDAGRAQRPRPPAVPIAAAVERLFA